MECLRFFSFNDVVPLGHLPRDIGTPLRAMRSISENSPFVGVPGGNSLEVPAFGKPAACQTDVGGVDRRKNLGAQFHGKGAPKGVARGNFSRFGRGRSPFGVRDSNEVLSLLNTAESWLVARNRWLSNTAGWRLRRGFRLEHVDFGGDGAAIAGAGAGGGLRHLFGRMLVRATQSARSSRSCLLRP